MTQPATTPQLLVVLPLYNEISRIRDTIASVTEFAAKRRSFCFLFVDDGSSDGCGELLRELASHPPLPNINALLLTQNAGKGNAVRRGFEYCLAEAYAFTDGDLAYDLNHMDAIFEALKGADVVIGSRELVPHIERNSIRRKILGWGFNRIARLLLDLPYRDTQAGLKGFSANARTLILNHPTVTGFTFDVEWLYLSRRAKLKMTEIPATVSDAHSYKKGKVKLLRDSLRMLADMIKIRCNALCGRYD